MVNDLKRLLFCFFVVPILIPLYSCTFSQKQENQGVSETVPALRNIGNGICLDIRTGNMWQINRSGKYSSPQRVEQYIKDLQLADYSDWRLPTRNELFTLHDIFFRHLNGDCNIKPAGNYWSTSEEGEITPGRWDTDYLCGPESRYVESYDKQGYIRATRREK